MTMKLRAMVVGLICAQVMGCAAEVVDAVTDEDVGVARAALTLDRQYLLLDRQGRALTNPGSSPPTMTTPSTTSGSSRQFAVTASTADATFADNQVVLLFHGVAAGNDFLHYEGATLSLGSGDTNASFRTDKINAGNTI